LSDNSHAAVEFRHLQYFVAVAEDLHFGRAADRLFISQPALSQAIARLERSLDVKLFVRTRNNVELTDAGTELLGRARGILADRDTAVATVRRVGQGEAGVLSVGVALLGEHEVAPAFAALVDEYDELLLDRSVATTGRLLESLEARVLDAAVVYQVPVLATLTGIATEVIRRGRLAALVSRASALAKRRSVKLSDLRAERFLAPPCELASSSFGATMPEGTARAVQPEGTSVVPIEPPPVYSLALAWRRDDGSPLLRRFLDFMGAYRDEHRWRRGIS
jgi:DNA-binding transcriptional LysR family regulator